MRAAANDYLQNFRYHLRADQGGVDPMQDTVSREGLTDGSSEAGFQSITLPELSIEVAEYREGTDKWTKKFAGVPTVSDLSLMRGVVKQDTDFYDMVKSSVDGEEYRMDVTIMIYQRVEMGDANTATFSDDGRRIVCYNSFGIRAKPNGDLDSMTSDVSIGEMDMSVEKFEIKYK